MIVFAPPLVALLYVVTLLFQSAWLGQSAAVFTVMVIVAVGALAVFLRRRPLTPNVSSAARLVDQRSGAKDVFLTLATIDSTKQPEALMDRLRRQAAWFLARVDLKRDFSYRVKRSGYWSLSGSFVAAILIHLFFLMGQPGHNAAAVPERLGELAKQMAARPDLRGLAKELETIAKRLNDPDLSEQEKQALAQQMQQKIEEQQKKDEQRHNRDLLNEAVSALDGQKQQQGRSGQKSEKQQQGAGGIQTNAPQDGQGESKQSEGGSGDGKGESSAQLNQGMDPGKSSEVSRNQRGQDKNPSADSKNNQKRSDPNQPGNDPDKEKAGKTQGGSKEGAGKQQASAEPPPQGGPPAERFYKAGEGKEGLKGAGYVTVQLPEEVVADAKGESRVTNQPNKSQPRTQVPVSNVPLPAHVPNAPAEKQPLPIEYRGIIR